MSAELLGTFAAVLAAFTAVLTSLWTRRKMTVDTANVALDMYIKAADHRFKVIETQLASTQRELVLAEARIMTLEQYILEKGLEVPS